ncbi:MAG: methionine adenosyltransferase [bacterium]|nr:methionine adenosyltransferase [bacterium]
MHKTRDYAFTSESVTEGHPDKICDQISDAVIDAVLSQDPNGRVACETFITVGMVIVGGEITTTAKIDAQKIARDTIKKIGYTGTKFGFDFQTCGVMNAIGHQSPDIAQGVDIGGAGDQGLMVGYACRETKELMPLPIMLSHQLARQLTFVRKKGILSYLGPDGKSQVTIEYKDNEPFRVDTVLISSQHTEEILDETGKHITQKSIDEIIENVIIPVIDKNLMDDDTRFLVNPTGKFVIGGPVSDTGMTGRKIIVDTYGGMVAHGGGAFSGKDPSKVDRSASYAARYVAKNIVAAGLADKCTVQLAYAIGVREPVSVMVDTMGTAKISVIDIEKAVRESFDLTPKGITKMLDLKRPIYSATAAYGHFGREEFSWEKLDKVDVLKKYL